MASRTREDVGHCQTTGGHVAKELWLTFLNDRPSSARESSWPRKSKDHHMESSTIPRPGLIFCLAQLQPRAAPRDPGEEPLRHQGHAVAEQPWPGQDSVLLAILWVDPIERAMDVSGRAISRDAIMELTIGRLCFRLLHPHPRGSRLPPRVAPPSRRDCSRHPHQAAAIARPSPWYAR